MTDHNTMSFGDHLEELRKRLLLGLALPIPISIVTFLFSNTLIEVLVLPLHRALEARGMPTRLQTLTPPELLLTQMKLSIITALIVSAPWLVWQLWLFIRPGLYQHEQRFVHFLIPGSAILTLCGVALMYFAMLPLMLGVLVSVGSSISVGGNDATVAAALEARPTIEATVALPEEPAAGAAFLLLPEMELYVSVADGDAFALRRVERTDRSLVAHDFRISQYISFVLMLFLGIVLAFQTPLVIVLMGWMGLADAGWLRSKRRYALVACGIIAAIITPADVISMMAMLLPLYALYELGILLLKFAPAHRVAGGLLGRGKDTDKLPASSPQPDEPSQTAAPEITSTPQDEPDEQSSDGEGDNR